MLLKHEEVAMVFAGVMLSRLLRPPARSEVAAPAHHHKQVFRVILRCEGIHDFDMGQVLPACVDFILAFQHEHTAGL